MRKVKLCVFIALVIPLIVSCGKDEVSSNSLEGRWNILYVESETRLQGEVISFDKETYNKGDYMEFRKDGQLIIWAFADKIETNYQVVDNRLFIANVYDTDFSPNGLEIQRNGNKLILIEEWGPEESDYGFAHTFKIYLEK